MKKKIFALGLAALLGVTSVATLSACGETGSDKIKVGMIALHDSQSTYDKNFIDAIQTACNNKGAELLLRTSIGEDDACYQAAADLVDQGCDIIFADSFGHEPFILQAAKEFPDVMFGHATGTHANGANQANFHNAFASIYEGRYLAGVAAGMKLVEMANNSQLKAENYDADGNIKIGYVGAYTYAEVVSGYTSFYLGVKNTVEEALTDVSVSMEVQFTGSWYDEIMEKDAANKLISNGAALISQHADSLGAPSACEEKDVPNVSYNGSTESTCPDTFIVSSKINWVPYFEHMIDCRLNNTALETDWCGTIATESVQLTSFGKVAAAGTEAKVNDVKAKLADGSLKVFDTASFTCVNAAKVEGFAGAIDENGHLTSYRADVDGDYKPDTEVVANGVFQESTLPAFRSAPYFDIQIDGITLLNTKF